MRPALDPSFFRLIMLDPNPSWIRFRGNIDRITDRQLTDLSGLGSRSGTGATPWTPSSWRT